MCEISGIHTSYGRTQTTNWISSELLSTNCLRGMRSRRW